MFVWVVTGSTESGDDIIPEVYEYKPSTEEVIKDLKLNYPEEYEAFGSDDAINFHISGALETIGKDE